MTNVAQDNTDSNIIFSFDTEEVLRFNSDGKVYIRGKLVDDNQKVYSAMLNFLTNAGTLKVSEWEDGEELSVDDL